MNMRDIFFNYCKDCGCRISEDCDLCRDCFESKMLSRYEDRRDDFI